MPEKVTESIFNSKTNLYENFPAYRGVKYFDLERKHFLYGKIDKKGDAIYLQSSDGSPTGANLEQINTEFAVDFVVDAFTEMRLYIQKMAHGGHINKNSPYNSFIKVYKAWRHGDLENSYYKHINKIYTDYVNNYLSNHRRVDEIKNFGDFVYSFMSYVGQIAYYFPLTKTGYILSHHCSPFVSGLMIEVAREQHGVENNKNILKYVNDPNYEFFVNTARKFGFMVDKNAPWRLVYNIGSSVKYMGNYGVNSENIFDFYYDKAHLNEVDSLRNYMHALYTTFYSQFGTFSKPKYTAGLGIGCNKTKVTHQYEEREPPPNMGAKFGASQINTLSETLSSPGEVHPLINVLHDEYWIKIILKLRMLESGAKHDKDRYIRIAKEMIRSYRLFGLKYPLSQINDFTKGLIKSKFLREGKYWYGDSKHVHEAKKIESNKKIFSPDRTDYQITSALNKS